MAAGRKQEQGLPPVSKADFDAFLRGCKLKVSAEEQKRLLGVLTQEVIDRQLVGSFDGPAIVRDTLRTALSSCMSPAQQQQLAEKSGKTIDVAAALGDLYSNAVALCLRVSLANLERESEENRAVRARANKELLQQLPDSVQLAVARGDLSVGHAKELLALPDRVAQEELAELVIVNSLAIDATARLAMWARSRTGPPDDAEPALRALFEQWAPLTKDHDSGDPRVMEPEGRDASPPPTTIRPGPTDEAASFDAVDLSQASTAAGFHIRKALAATLRTAGKEHDFDAALDAIESTFDASRTVLVEGLEDYLRSLEGKSFGGIDSNQKFAAKLNRTLRQLGYALVCQSCGDPASLRVAEGNSPGGSFQFLHSTYQGRRNVPHMGRASAPLLEIVRRQG